MISAEDNAGPAPIPDDPDELAELIAESRRTYLQSQQKARMARAAVGMPPPELERTWAGIEGMLDRLADDIRQATAALTARCAQVIADTGELTARQAWHLLIAIGADEEALDGWREQPQGTTRLLTGYLSLGPGSPEDKLAGIAQSMGIGGGPGKTPRTRSLDRRSGRPVRTVSGRLPPTAPWPHRRRAAPRARVSPHGPGGEHDRGAHRGLQGHWRTSAPRSGRRARRTRRRPARGPGH
jgi:hypothetical protein